MSDNRTRQLFIHIYKESRLGPPPSSDLDLTCEACGHVVPRWFMRVIAWNGALAQDFRADSRFDVDSTSGDQHEVEVCCCCDAGFPYPLPGEQMRAYELRTEAEEAADAQRKPQSGGGP